MSHWGLGPKNRFLGHLENSRHIGKCKLSCRVNARKHRNLQVLQICDSVADFVRVMVFMMFIQAILTYPNLAIFIIRTFKANPGGDRLATFVFASLAIAVAR